MATARRLLPQYDMPHAGASALTHEIGLPPSTGRVASRSLEDVLRRRRSIRSSPRPTTRKYGERGVRYAHVEAGHAAQNVCLQAAALGLRVVVVGAFEDDEVRRVIGAARTETPLCLLPVGRPG
ncbi:MAG: nitroreductase family protein [Candidatus Rokubacteria bacterium]|nr:nitroreductase family protein [Candidatus Rokubacteria bacterium]